MPWHVIVLLQMWNSTCAGRNRRRRLSTKNFWISLVKWTQEFVHPVICKKSETEKNLGECFNHLECFRVETKSYFQIWEWSNHMLFRFTQVLLLLGMVDMTWCEYLVPFSIQMTEIPVKALITTQKLPGDKRQTSFFAEQKNDLGLSRFQCRNILGRIA
jgi:hypothetical protein